MSNLIEKLFDELNRHILVYIFIFLAIVFGLFLGNGVAGLALFSFAIGILVGQKSPI